MIRPCSWFRKPQILSLMAAKTVRRWLLTIIGIISVGLGTAGIFLPLLPTTPYLHLAAACFIRSSNRPYQWLPHNQWFGFYLRNYREHRAIPLPAKVIALILLWTTIMSYSGFVLITNWALGFILLLLAFAVTLP